MPRHYNKLFINYCIININPEVHALITADMTSCRKRNGGLVSSLSLSGGFFTILPRLFWVFLMASLRLAMMARAVFAPAPCSDRNVTLRSRSPP